MGNVFSGYYGRRNELPYLDQLPRVLAGEVSRSKFHENSGCMFIPFNGFVHLVAVVRVRVGALNQYRFICEKCGKRCRIVYLVQAPICRPCTKANYRSQSESQKHRIRHKAYKTLERVKLDPTHPRTKIPRRHWKTHWHLLNGAESAIKIIVSHNEKIMSLLRRDKSREPKHKV
jgi:hypothetical protein